MLSRQRRPTPTFTLCLFSLTVLKKIFLKKSSPRSPVQTPPVCVCVSASVQTKRWSSSVHLFQFVDGHRGASTMSAHYSPRATDSMSRAPPLVQIPQIKRTRSVTFCQHAKLCLYHPPPPTSQKSLFDFIYLLPEIFTPSTRPTGDVSPEHCHPSLTPPETSLSITCQAVISTATRAMPNNFVFDVPHPSQTLLPHTTATALPFLHRRKSMMHLPIFVTIL